MNILIVLAVVAVFAVLRFLRANLLTWAIAWWVGIYVLVRFGFTAPIPASVVTLYMGIITIAILAYMSSSQERREVVLKNTLRRETEWLRRGAKARTTKQQARIQRHGEITDELYLATFARLPSEQERKVVAETLVEIPSRQEAWEDVLWSLLNSSEFVFQH